MPSAEPKLRIRTIGFELEACQVWDDVVRRFLLLGNKSSCAAAMSYDGNALIGPAHREPLKLREPAAAV
jgi:hypothetical protein